MQTVEQRRANVANYVKFGLAGLAMLVISPIVFLIVKGIVGLAVAAILGLTVINFAPVVSMKFANWKVKAIVAEAKENPIETLTNLLAAKRQAFARFQESVNTAATAEKNFAQKCKQFAQQYPARAAEFTAQLAAMHELVERKKAALNQAHASIEDGENKLVEMRAYWDMSQAAREANRAAGMDTGDDFEKLKADTAVDAVFESMNRAFAELEVAAAINSPQIETTNVPMLEATMIIPTVSVQQTQRVQR